ncbi:MAG: hypothetical protein KA120_06340 [Candidatus Goldbacteria bacterium]|nr:hypothetical protein [Candidatus Goldiibacteriota bacterium]
MGPDKYDTKNGKYKQLKESERWKIEAYLKVGLKSEEIAEKIGRNRSRHLSTMLCFRIKEFNIEQLIHVV